MTHHLQKSTGVYQITNLVDGKVYVGSAAKSFASRWQTHRSNLRNNKHRNTKLQNAWNLYGEATFRFGVVLLCSPENCLLFEQRAIDSLNAVVEGYNIDPVAGSKLGFKHSEQAKAKIGIANTGRTCSTFQRERLSQTHKGKQISQEHRDAISRANKGKTVSIETRAKHAAASRGRTHSEETKRKIGAATISRNKLKLALDNREV